MGTSSALADWLGERGDPLGELITIQCALGRALMGAGAKMASREGRKLPFDSRQELEAREKELVKRYEQVWLAPFRRHIREWTLRRGFVEHVVADVGAFVEGLPALLRVPITSVDLTGFKPPMADSLLRAPRHPSLRTMRFTQNRIGPRLVHVLESALFSTARTLGLYGNPLGTAGARVLAAQPFPELEDLQISRTEMTDEGLELLSRAPFFPRLRRLDLTWNDALGRHGGTSATVSGSVTAARILRRPPHGHPRRPGVRATLSPMLEVASLHHVRPPRALHFPEEALVPETKRHFVLRTALHQILAAAVGPAASLGSDQFVYWNARDPSACLAPDAFVKLGRIDDDFPVWKVWERGAPDVAAEILSPSDQETFARKVERYHELGVRELVAFDPDAPEGSRLRVWDRVDDDLVERVVEEDRAVSRVLGLLWVVAPVEGRPGLRVARDAQGCELVPTLVEARDTETRARADAEKRLAEALAELERLRRA